PPLTPTARSRPTPHTPTLTAHAPPLTPLTPLQLPSQGSTPERVGSAPRIPGANPPPEGSTHRLGGRRLRWLACRGLVGLGLAGVGGAGGGVAEGSGVAAGGGGRGVEAFGEFAADGAELRLRGVEARGDRVAMGLPRVGAALHEQRQRGSL